MLYFLIIPLYFHYVHVHGSPVSSLFFLPNDKPVPQEVKPQNIVIHVKKGNQCLMIPPEYQKAEVGMGMKRKKKSRIVEEKN